MLKQAIQEVKFIPISSKNITLKTFVAENMCIDYNLKIILIR